MKTNLLNYDLNGLTQHFAEMGEKPFRAKQVMRWMHQAGAQNFEEMTDLAKSLRAKLNEQATIEVPKLMMAQESTDGTRKWLLEVYAGVQCREDQHERANHFGEGVCEVVVNGGDGTEDAELNPRG